MRLRPKSKKLLTILLLIVAGLSAWLVLELFAESQGANTAFFYLVVTGNGEGKMTGYYGYMNDPELGGEFYSHLYAEVLPSVDIQNIALLANASGYETILVAKPLNYSPYPHSIAIRNRVVLYPNNVPINFTIIVLENGYLTVAVNSDYYLRDDWMRNVFKRMLQDVNLLPSIITRFELSVNHIYHGSHPDLTSGQLVGWIEIPRAY